MMPRAGAICGVCFFLFCSSTAAQEPAHEHPAPEKLGKVAFSTSCRPEVQTEFNRAVALLHSFAYSAADEAFAGVTAADSECAMAHWGRAMSQIHQLWEPALSPSGLERGRAEWEQAQQSRSKVVREREYIAALGEIFRDAGSQPYESRARRYEEAMSTLAAHNPADAEAQIFYALSLLAIASPEDRTHSNQKKAAEILEPLHRNLPEHPGIVHYLIHAYDNAEMAARGLPAAREYAQIAPSAPHALHMPSHIFTRLGMWEESIRSNLAAQAVAHDQGDTGEELHAMDYLVYAYLQRGRNSDAEGVLRQLEAMGTLPAGQFKSGYAATAMPVRYAVERRQWGEAALCHSSPEAQRSVAAIAAWARAIGLARGGHPAEAGVEIRALRQMEVQLRTSGSSYWATQVHIQMLEASAWVRDANGNAAEAASLLREAADTEDNLEKLPVTPGPVVPAREQLGDLLLQQGHPQQALTEFESSLQASPGRRGALQGALAAAEKSNDEPKARLYRLALQKGS
jgi:tetratricopeptide (TPR) repeat protein